MISYLKGTLISKQENGPSGATVVIDVNNIGYLVNTNKKVINSLPKVGEVTVIHTSLIHREDAMILCGFINHEDKDLFNILLSVSGVGLKVALLLLEEFGAHELVSAVVSSDVKTLCRTKGIGPKVAQRIILELKDKMTSWRDSTSYETPEVAEISNKDVKESYLEAESVLLSLGYTKEEANESLGKSLSLSDNTENAEELLKNALKWLSSK